MQLAYAGGELGWGDGGGRWRWSARRGGAGFAGAGVVRGDAGRVAAPAAGQAAERAAGRHPGAGGAPVRRVHRRLAVAVDARRRRSRGWPRAGGRTRRRGPTRARWACSWSMPAIRGMAGWPSASSGRARCRSQVFHEGNTAVHAAEYEGRPERRPLTRAELQAFFDAADGLAERAAVRGARGSWRRSATPPCSR